MKGQCPNRLDDRAASCIGWTRTSNLLINSQTHYHCATIQCASLGYKVLANLRQLTLPKRDFHLQLKFSQLLTWPTDQPRIAIITSYCMSNLSHPRQKHTAFNSRRCGLLYYLRQYASGGGGGNCTPVHDNINNNVYNHIKMGYRLRYREIL